MTDIIAAAATAHGVTVAEMTAGMDVTYPALALARRQAVSAMHAYGLSYVKIATIMNMSNAGAHYYGTVRKPPVLRRLKAKVYETEVAETPIQARARVARELAEGKRCQRCHLTLPCNGEAPG